MLPFPVVHPYGNIVPTKKRVLDIDFSTQSVGDNFIRDNMGTTFTLSSGSAGSVQYDSVLGRNVFKFNNGYYKSPSIIAGSKLDLTNKDFEIILQFKSNSSSALQVVWETGNFGSRRIYGINASVNQYVSQYFQFFVDNGSYNRVLLDGANPKVWDTITYRYQKGIGITVNSTYYNKTQNYPAWAGGMGTNLSIGGSYVNGDGNSSAGYYFDGSIAKFKISLL